MDKLHYYLGTGLKIREEWKPSFTNQPNTFSEEELTAKNIDSVGKKRYRLISSKPLMRPLSSLTKPITVEGYNGGEPFVPIYELTHIENTRNPDCIQDFEWSVHNNPLLYFLEKGQYDDYDSIIIYSVETGIDYTPHYIFELLCTWHFWIGDQSDFGKSLIEIKD